MILSISDVAEKKRSCRTISVKVYFGDSLTGQSFTVERPDEELTRFITTVFAAKNLQAAFSENGEHFTVKRKS